MVYKKKQRSDNPYLVLSLIIMTAGLFFQLNCSGGTSTKTQFTGDFKSRKIGEVSDLMKAPHLLVDDTQVYVWDKFLCRVYIYSKNDFRKIAQFGKRGAGPAEFRIIHSVILDDNYIYVNSAPKLSIFSKNGEFVKEIKGTAMAMHYMPIGDKFIGRITLSAPKARIGKVKYVLFDSNLVKIKDIFESEYFKETVDVTREKFDVLWFNGSYKGVVYKDRFYVASTYKGFYIAVFDAQGNKLYEIEKDYQKRPVTDKTKKRLLDSMRKSMGDEAWKKYSSRQGVIFPDYFPAFINFAVGADRIYVFKYPISGAPTLDVLSLDLKGNLMDVFSLPSHFWRSLALDGIYFHEGKVYTSKAESIEDAIMGVYEGTFNKAP